MKKLLISPVFTGFGKSRTFGVQNSGIKHKLPAWLHTVKKSAAVSCSPEMNFFCNSEKLIMQEEYDTIHLWLIFTNLFGRER